jgi:curved DNA-binding protein CbpA
MPLRPVLHEMMDAFEQLGLPRQVDLSEDELRRAFRAAGKRLHPDAGGSEAEFSRLQEAFGLLSSASRRLKHWLVLQGVSGDERGPISPGVMDLFGEVGTVLQHGDALARRRTAARSALALALLESETQACREEVERMISVVDHGIADLITGVGCAVPDSAWITVRDLAFLEKWRTKLRECFSGLV